MSSIPTPESPSAVKTPSRHLRRCCLRLTLPKARRSRCPTTPLYVGFPFRGGPDSLSLRPVELLASLRGSDQHWPALGDFYIRAFADSVGLLDVGHDYRGSLGRLHGQDSHLLGCIRRLPLCVFNSDRFLPLEASWRTNQRAAGDFATPHRLNDRSARRIK